FSFRNPVFMDDFVDGNLLGDMENQQTGDVSLMSVDPLPHLPPHTYLEWFSERGEHYRIELAAGGASITNADEERALEHEVHKIVQRLSALPAAPTRTRDDSGCV